MRKIIKISLTLFLILSCLFAMVQIKSNADYASEISDFISSGEHKDETGTSDKVNTLSGIILTTIRIIGVTVAIVMLFAVAMKYMTAAPGEKADIKKSAIQYVIGAIVLFATVGILTIISQFSTGIQAGS